MENELRCPVCNEYFTEPVMLQCSHHICHAHVGNVTNRERLACPVCSDVMIVPETGLSVDRTLQVVVDLFQQDQASVPASDPRDVPAPMCGFCEEKPARRRCVQCAGVLCEECELTSHSKGFFKSHNIVDLEDGEAAVGSGGFDYASKMLCDEHPEEKLSFYCLGCRRPVCSHCLILGEHKGHQQTPIDQASETGKETLTAWVEKLSQRIMSHEQLIEQLKGCEAEVNKGAEAQRNIINSEMDHLKDLIETKRQQLLSKSVLEEKQKRMQLQAQVDRAEKSRTDTAGLIQRSEALLGLSSAHAFLAVVLPLIQDMKKCAGQPMDTAPTVSCAFRPLSTDSQVRSLGDLDLGHPRPPQPVHMAGGQSVQIGGPGVEGQQVLPQSYSIANSTLSYLPQQSIQMPQGAQVQYVYRTVPAS